MKRVAESFKELYVGSGPRLLCITIGLAIVLGAVGGLGHLTLDFFVY